MRAWFQLVTTTSQSPLALIGLIGAFAPDKMKAALLILAVLAPFGTASAQSPILPWRAQMHQRLQKLENQPHATAHALADPGAGAPADSHLLAEPAGEPAFGTLPIQG
jgi:hypothetical protein